MHRISALFLILLICSLAVVAEPPDRLNYQGVLRDGAGQPLSGDYDMVFRFWSAETLGEEVLLDRHLLVNGQAVSVTGGLLSVALGSGEIVDGSGAGVYTALESVFADHADVWLEIQVETETLSPRIRIASAAYALNASRLDGRDGSEFLDASANEQSKLGRLVVGQTAGSADASGIEGYGTDLGGLFENLTVPANQARLATVAYGVEGSGDAAGGYFADSNNSGYGYVGRGGYGVEAYGNALGGLFVNSLVESNQAWLATQSYGIQAKGGYAGGYFWDTNNSGYGFVGVGSNGMEGYGNALGGYFANQVETDTEARLASQTIGVEGRGPVAGAYFFDTDGSGNAFVGLGHSGIVGKGTWQAFRNGGGGTFEDLTYTGKAYVAHGNEGIYAEGSFAGGEFTDTDSGGTARIGTSTYKVLGTGAVSFVQNHPEDPDSVIVYHAPESSEVAVYTRGKNRLVNGAARVALDPTFEWVANPDLGLTVHLTPRGRSCALHVVGVSTTTLDVASDDLTCTSVAFDYLVYGLRIGFEESTVVQPKTAGAPLPSMKDHRDVYLANPSLRRFNALERFLAIELELGERAATDTDASRATALIESIGRFEPISGEATRALHADDPSDADAPIPERYEPSAGVVERNSCPEMLPSSTRMPVTGTVEAGDVLVLAPDDPGRLVRVQLLADPAIVGVALDAGQTTPDAETTVAISTSGIAPVRVDAGFGAIRPGDLLVGSPTPGHAMRAIDLRPGIVLGKALESLDSGTGTIRVLVGPR